MSTTMGWIYEQRFPLNASPERVFQALTDPAELEAWFAEHVDVAVHGGGPYRFWGKHTPGAPARGDQNLTVVERPSRLGFEWTLFGCPSEVTFGLLPTDEGTQFMVRHELRGSLDQPRPRELVDDWWRLTAGNLAAHLAGGAGVLRPDFGDSAPEIQLSLVINASPEEVFRALVDPAQLNQWIAAAAEVDLRVGGAYNYGWVYEHEGRSVVGGPSTILELIPNKLLVLDWPDWRGDETVPTQFVRWELEPEGEGTRVTFVHGGFTRAADWSDYPFGWGGFLTRLEETVLGATK
jgi:uncharacterized protein YndB with AHSA1/START domain